MSEVSSKAGSAGAMAGRRDYGGGEPRRLSLLGRLSNLLSHLGAADGQPTKNRASLEALRERMTPPQGTDEAPLAVRLRRRERAFIPAAERPVFDAQSRALDDFPQDERVESDWKPVLLSEEEMPPAIPSLDELAEEGGIEPSMPRFPIDS